MDASTALYYTEHSHTYIAICILVRACTVHQGYSSRSWIGLNYYVAGPRTLDDAFTICLRFLPCSLPVPFLTRANSTHIYSPMPRRENANNPASAQAQQEAVSEGIENFELPRALVTRIAKSAVRCRFSYRYRGALFSHWFGRFRKT
jgi:hypothetical protein